MIDNPLRREVEAPTHVCYTCGEWWDVRAGSSHLLVHAYGLSLMVTWVEASDTPLCPLDGTTLREWAIQA